MGLASQAERLRRRTWPDDLKLAMDEIYLAFLTDVDQKTGPISVTLPGADQPFTLPSLPGLSPLPPFDFPNLLFPDLILPNLPNFNSTNLTNPRRGVDGQVQIQRVRRQTTQANDQIATVPAVIIGGAGPSYGLLLFPNGRAGGPSMAPVDAVELNGKANLAAGTWVLCFRHVHSELTITTEIEQSFLSGTELAEKVISTYTDVKVISQNNEFVGGEKTGGGAFGGFIVSGTQNNYIVRIFPDGRDQSDAEVAATQLQIASGETLPAGTAVLVARETDADGTNPQYFIQSPIWLRRAT